MDNRISIIPKYIICVDRILNGVLSGRVYCGCMPDGKHFGGIEELVLMIDTIMDKVGFPQSTVDKRGFGQKQDTLQRADRETLIAMRRFDGHDMSGKCETFVLQVQFRQNASWQGSIQHSGSQISTEFRSVLELIRIMDNACSMAITTENNKKNA